MGGLNSLDWILHLGKGGHELRTESGLPLEQKLALYILLYKIKMKFYNQKRWKFEIVPYYCGPPK